MKYLLFLSIVLGSTSILEAKIVKFLSQTASGYVLSNQILKRDVQIKPEGCELAYNLSELKKNCPDCKQNQTIQSIRVAFKTKEGLTYGESFPLKPQLALSTFENTAIFHDQYSDKTNDMTFTLSFDNKTITFSSSKPKYLQLGNDKEKKLVTTENFKAQISLSKENFLLPDKITIIKHIKDETSLFENSVPKEVVNITCKSFQPL